MTENEFSPIEQTMKAELEAKEFELKEAYWIHAQKLIHGHRRKRRILFFILSSAGLCLVAGSLLVLFPAGQRDQLTPETATQGFTPSAGESSISLPSSASTTANGNTKNEKINTPPKAVIQKPYQNNQLTKQQAIETPQVSASTRNAEKNITSNSDPSPEKNIRPLTVPAPTLLSNAPPYEILKTDLRTLSAKFNIDFPDSLLTIDLAAVTTQPDSSTTKSPLWEKHTFIAVGGLTYFNPVRTAPNNLGLSTGLMYSRNFRSGFSIQTGLLYSGLHQNIADLNYQKIHFGFGKETDKTTIKTLRLDYVQVPIDFSSRIFKNNSISAGVTCGFLFHSANRVIREKSVDKTLQSTRSSGYTYAINRHDIQLTFAYHFYLTEKMRCTLRYSYGLTDISKNSVFGAPVFNRNSGLGISVGYKFISR